MQIRYRLQYSLEDKLYPNRKKRAGERAASVPQTRRLQLMDSIPGYTAFYPPARFRFLNLEQTFEHGIDWNFSAHGKLWTYNLNYFEFLLQPDLPAAAGLQLIHDFIRREDGIKDGMDPFPISLRTIFWIRFLAKHQIRDKEIDRSLYRQLLILRKRLEYHLLGNHLLENAFALVFGAVYFSDALLWEKAEKLLRTQLEEQVLSDGAHFELSPMYHQLMLYRLLDVINLLWHQPFGTSNKLLPLLREKAGFMLSWMRNISFANGELPRVNDSTPGIAPKPSALFDYASRLGVAMRPVNQGTSGYRKVNTPRYELLIDVGQIGPDYIPGHAHSDTFNFILHHRYQPLIVDTGISTYEKNARRQLERSTAAHNTVMVAGREQSEVWGGFRVARRARVISRSESENELIAGHDGYQSIGLIHQRSFLWKPDRLQIHDQLSGDHPAIASFHFHPNVRLQIVGQEVTGNFGTIRFTPSPVKLSIQTYDYALGFNCLLEAKKVVVEFRHALVTKIELL